MKWSMINNTLLYAWSFRKLNWKQLSNALIENQRHTLRTIIQISAPLFWFVHCLCFCLHTTCWQFWSVTYAIINLAKNSLIYVDIWKSVGHLLQWKSVRSVEKLIKTNRITKCACTSQKYKQKFHTYFPII